MWAEVASCKRQEASWVEVNVATGEVLLWYSRSQGNVSGASWSSDEENLCEFMGISRDIISGELAGDSSTRNTKTIRCRFLGIQRNTTKRILDENELSQNEKPDCCPELLRKNSLSTCPFFETFMEFLRVQDVSYHSVLTFKPLHSLHLGL